MNGLVKRGGFPPAIEPRALALLAGYGLFAMTRERMAQIDTRPVPEWITLPEASLHMGLSVPLLKRLIAAGKLKAIRDRSIKVRRSDLDNLDNLSEMSECTKRLGNAVGELRKTMRARR